MAKCWLTINVLPLAGKDIQRSRTATAARHSRLDDDYGYHTMMQRTKAFLRACTVLGWAMPLMAWAATPAAESLDAVGPQRLAQVGSAVLVAAAESPQADETATDEASADNPHEDIFAEERFPSAQLCKTCHEDHYTEWSVSPHAYAMLSPVFNSMHATIVKRTNGTQGDFCIRCHTPVGMTLEEPLFTTFNHAPHMQLLQDKACQTCHRLDNQADFLGSYKKNPDPSVFQSNFKPLEQSKCAECHRQNGSGDSCLICHRYHVGTVSMMAKTPAPSQTVQD